MSKNKIHLVEKVNGNFHYSCNHAVSPRFDFMTKLIQEVTCQNCLKKLKHKKYSKKIRKHLIDKRKKKVELMNTLMKLKENQLLDSYKRRDNIMITLIFLLMFMLILILLTIRLII